MACVTPTQICAWAVRKNGATVFHAESPGVVRRTSYRAVGGNGGYGFQEMGLCCGDLDSQPRHQS